MVKAYYKEEKNTPFRVKAIAVFQVIISTLLFVLVIAYTLFVRFDTTPIDSHTKGYGRAIILTLGFYIVIPFSIISFLSSLALLKRKKWGRILQVIISIISIFVSLYLLIIFTTSMEYQNILLAIILGFIPFIIYCLIVYYLLFNKEVEE